AGSKAALAVSSKSSSAMSRSGDDHSTGRGSRRGRYVPIFHRLAALNALVVLGAVALTIVVLAPRKLSALSIDGEAAVLVGAVGLVVLVNVLLLRRVIRPLQALTEQARRVDLARPAVRMPG